MAAARDGPLDLGLPAGAGADREAAGVQPAEDPAGRGGQGRCADGGRGAAPDGRGAAALRLSVRAE